jgi:hypothetical protein
MLDMTCSRSKLQGQRILSRSYRSIARWLNVAKGWKEQVTIMYADMYADGTC